MATASTHLDRAERTLGFDRTSVGVPGLESTQLLAVLNDAVLEYHLSFEKGGGEPSTILRRETGYTLVSDTALAADVASGATSFTVDDSSDLGSSGALAIWDNDRPDYVEFGVNDLATALSTVTGVSFAHETDDVVSLLYALPSTFKSMRSEEGYEDGVSVDGRAYFYTSGSPTGYEYSIYDNGTTKYLHFPRSSSGDVFVRYNVAPTTVDGESDAVDIPTEDEWFATWRVVQYAAPLLERADMYQISAANALRILSDSHKRRNIGKRPRVRPVRRIGNTPPRSYLFDD